jgi:DNA-binding LacI/PurR family transcriptional regulator
MQAGHPLLAVHSGRRTPEEIVEQLAALHASGVLLTAYTPELIRAIQASGIPAVLVDAFTPDCGIDAVVQDDFMGGYLAASHLVRQGCKRLAWFGPVGETHHSLERFGGACAALRSHGLSFLDAHVCDPALADAGPALEALLKSPQRPQAVLALWSDRMRILKETADRLGLSLGRDVQTVGWVERGLYPHSYRDLFPASAVPPMVTWDSRDMAGAALDLLDKRRRGSKENAVKVVVPVALSGAPAAGGVGTGTGAASGR